MRTSVLSDDDGPFASGASNWDSQRQKRNECGIHVMNIWNVATLTSDGSISLRLLFCFELD